PLGRRGAVRPAPTTGMSVPLAMGRRSSLAWRAVLRGRRVRLAVPPAGVSTTCRASDVGRSATSCGRHGGRPSRLLPSGPPSADAAGRVVFYRVGRRGAPSDGQECPSPLRWGGEAAILEG